MANLNPALNDELGFDTSETGVAILKIKNGSIAQNLRFQQGDVILKVNGHAIVNVQDLRIAVGQMAQRWVLSLRRGGETMTLTLGG